MQVLTFRVLLYHYPNEFNSNKLLFVHQIAILNGLFIRIKQPHGISEYLTNLGVESGPDP